MRILNIFKRVPDTYAEIKLSKDNSDIDKENLNYVIDPYGEYAMETSLRIKDKDSSIELVVLTIGPENSTELLRNALALGFDISYLIKYENYEKLSPLALSKIYIKFIEKYGPFDIIFLPKVDIDTNFHSICGYLAGYLNINFITSITTAEIVDNHAIVERETSVGKEKLKIKTPCILSHDKAPYEIRLASLKGIMLSKKKPINIIELSELEIKIEEHIIRNTLRLPPQRKGVKFLNNADELIKVLKEEIKIL
ncbi:MAG: electron transfer flavoprotein subunit beta/FixA family protein [candidate division WOR-3 bacterium]|nr:electron transfer flavoprotein subunit beta/FixA family protein [candidate division WOR-3 bacterium]